MRVHSGSWVSSDAGLGVISTFRRTLSGKSDPLFVSKSEQFIQTTSVQ